MHVSFAMIFVCAFAICAGQIQHFGPVNQVNDMVQSGDTLYLATGGGVVSLSTVSNQTISVEHDFTLFPDICMKAIHRSDDGTLWVGSKSGYLYKKESGGRWVRYDDFYIASVQINRIRAYGQRYLLVAHSKGITVFDTNRGLALSTIAEPAGFTGNVGEMVVVGDTLFAGVDTALVRYDSLATGLLKLSFRNRSSWDTVTTGSEKVKGIIHDAKGVRSFSGAAMLFGDTLLVARRVTAGDRGDTLFQILGTDTLARKGQSCIVNAILKLSSGEPVIALSDEFIKRDPLVIDTVIPLTGPVHGQYGRTIITSTGELWMTPFQWSGQPSLDEWRGITRFNDNGFRFYNMKTPGITSLGDFWTVRGLTEGADGSIWVGTSGGGVKSWNPATDSWTNWRVMCDKNSGVDTIYPLQPTEPLGWQKIDGVVRDSSGLIWFVLWNAQNAPYSNKYRFGVLNPATGKYRFLHSRFDNSNVPSTASVNPYQCVVDSRGNRWFLGCVGDGEQGTNDANNDAFVFYGTADPFSDTAEVAGKGFGYLDTLTGVSAVKSVVAAPNRGPVLIANNNGIAAMFVDGDSLADGGVAIDTSIHESWSLDYKKPAHSIAVERCFTEPGKQFRNAAGESLIADSCRTTVFWASITGIGIERFVLNEYLVDMVSSKSRKKVVYAQLDLEAGKKPEIIPVDQFEFVKEARLTIDPNKRLLWIASEKGLGSYELGISTERGVPDNSFAEMYPNPFSKSKHSRVTITGLSANSFVDMYTLSGKLVAHFDQEHAYEFLDATVGKSFSWVPSEDMAPGTYIVALKDADNKSMTQLKKLVIIP